ncbi:MAG TPA: hypothetical protein VHD32_05320 [Candidatus Didemnitutus sp.]|nr:hypothetical protein [Candidatus Didemnitutus sp.]
MVIIDSRPHFAASKRRDWWEAKVKLFHALAQFLTEEKFCRSNVLARFEAEPTAWQLIDDDFTPAGMRWVKEQLHPWLRRLDRRKTTLSFEEMLASLRKTRNA